MYRPGKPAHGPPPFGPPPPHGPPFRPAGSCGIPPPGHFPPGPCGPPSASAPDYLHNRPRGHFISPHCSSFSIDRSTVIALGGSQQIVPHAEPPHLQVPQWNPTPVDHHRPDNSDRAGEEFLRCIAANKPLPDYLKGNMAYNLADAIKSANVLKDAVKSDPELQKLVTRSKSRSRSCGRSRGRSRGKSRGKSLARSRSHIRSRSRGRSKSRVRGKSRARSKSRAKSKSRPRSMSRSKKKSHARSKSRVRRSRTRSNSSEKSHVKDRKRNRSSSNSSISSSNMTGKTLLEGLKLVMNSKELDERLPALKEAILTIQASDESKKVQSVSDEYRHQQHESQETSDTLDSDSMLLPHDRVGSDFSWLQEEGQEDATVRRAEELDDEESFLYGSEDTGRKQDNKSSSNLFESFSQIGTQSKLQETDIKQHHHTPFGSSGDLVDLKEPLQTTSSSLGLASLDSGDCEKIKSIIKSLGTADISDMVKMQGQKEEKQLSPAPPGSESAAANLAASAVNNPNVRHALESLQSLIKATKERRTKIESSGTPQTSDMNMAGDTEERKREIQTRISKMESLMKELEGLLKQDGVTFLTPVIGFYCQKCEEFIGDLNCAENHAAIHQHSAPNTKLQMGKFTGDSSSSNPQLPDRRDHRDSSYHGDPGDHRNHYHQDWRDEKDHRSQLDDGRRNNRMRLENISLKEEMSKERMLITVSRGLTPPPNVRVKKEVKEQTVGGYSKDKTEDTKKKDSREKESKEKDGSSDCSENDEKGKTTKVKSPKKKKKRKEKKKKKEKGDKS